MSKFKQDFEALKAKACKSCGGYGKCDDCSEHDIGYSTWTCRNCKGTGYQNNPEESTEYQKAIILLAQLHLTLMNKNKSLDKVNESDPDRKYKAVIGSKSPKVVLSLFSFFEKETSKDPYSFSEIEVVLGSLEDRKENRRLFYTESSEFDIGMLYGFYLEIE